MATVTTTMATVITALATNIGMANNPLRNNLIYLLIAQSPSQEKVHGQETQYHTAYKSKRVDLVDPQTVGIG